MTTWYNAQMTDRHFVDLDSNIQNDTAGTEASSNNALTEEGTQFANGIHIRTATGHADDTESQNGSTRPSSWQTSAIPVRAPTVILLLPSVYLTETKKKKVSMPRVRRGGVPKNGKKI